jgi:hypothetical protein
MAFRLFGFAIGINFYIFDLVFFRTGIPAIISVYIHIHSREARCCLYRFCVSILHDLSLLSFRDLFTFFAFAGREIYIIEELLLCHCAQRKRKHDR